MPGFTEAEANGYGGGSSSSAPLHNPQNNTPQPPPLGVYHLPPTLSKPSNPNPRVCMSWGSGNKLRLAYLQQPPPSSSTPMPMEMVDHTTSNGHKGGGVPVVEVQLGGHTTLGLETLEECERRHIAYGSLVAFAVLQNKRRVLFQDEGISADWWQHVMEYSHSIRDVLAGSRGSSSRGLGERSSKRKVEKTLLEAVWELTEVFYVNKNVMSWVLERLVDWVLGYNRAFARIEPTIQMKLAELQNKLPDIQFPEEYPYYWEGVASALAVGWLDMATKLLRMHGSYQLDQIDDRQTENGLVEAVTVLISKLPRLRPTLPSGAPGVAYGFKPEFAKAWEKWRSQVSKLDGSTFWSECSNRRTLLGLKKLLQILLGNVEALTTATVHWTELVVAHFLYIMPFGMGSREIVSIARKCAQLKPVSSNQNLVELLLAIMSNDTEIVLAECSQLFGPWMIAHIMELLTANDTNSQALLRQERSAIGGISLEELHRLVYAQVLASHPSTWQLSPMYLASCAKQGCGLLENILLKQPISGNSKLFLKVLDISRLYDLGAVGTALSRVMGMHDWKHGRKSAGIMWLQQARDDTRLVAIANQLADSVTALKTDDSRKSFQHLEGLLDLLDSEVNSATGLSFLQLYRDYKSSLQEIREHRQGDLSNPKVTAAGKRAADCLLQLLKPGAAPRRFWLSILQDSVELLEWPQEVLLNEVETLTLMTRLQDLRLAEVRGDAEAVSVLSSEQAKPQLDRVRLALALNLGRAVLES